MSDIQTAIEVLGDLQTWDGQCHQASLKLAQSKCFGPSRVARGFAEGVRSQHSWLVIGDDCYDKEAKIIDPTLWSYRDDIDGIWTGTLADSIHHPHGQGVIWEWGMPAPGGGPEIALESELGSFAESFLKTIGPLDAFGWGILLSKAPVEGWPAKEIFEAASKTPSLSALIPVDRLGMLTDLNPGKLYF